MGKADVAQMKRLKSALSLAKTKQRIKAEAKQMADRDVAQRAATIKNIRSQDAKVKARALAEKAAKKK